MNTQISRRGFLCAAGIASAAAALTACGGSSSSVSSVAGSAAASSEAASGESVELIVFAAASLTETLNAIAETYSAENPGVTFSFNFDSSGTLKTQIQDGADCDLVISDFYRVVGERVSRKGDIDEDRVLTREEYAAHMMEQPADFYYGVLWNKLYRRDIVADHHLQMDPEISWCEDFMFNLEYIRHAQRFYALQVPIYYYVKTKGSLASQSLSISKTIRMKLMLFEYYNQFYKSVLDEEEYEKSRLKVYRFLVDAAGDGAVPPTILPGSKKLGDERVSICPEALSGEGVLADSFRERKLLEQYLESAALKNGLSLPEARLLLALEQA